MGKKKKQKSEVEVLSIHKAITYKLTELYNANHDLLEFIKTRDPSISIDEFNGLPEILNSLDSNDLEPFYSRQFFCGGICTRRSYRDCNITALLNILAMYEGVDTILEDIINEIDSLEDAQLLPSERHILAYYKTATQKYRVIHKACRESMFGITHINEEDIPDLVNVCIKLIEDAANFNLTILELNSGEEE